MNQLTRLAAVLSSSALLSFSALTSGSPVSSDGLSPTPAVTQAAKLPGAGVQLERVVGNPEIIIAKGVLQSFDAESRGLGLGGPGQWDYKNVKFRLTRFLQGKCKKAITLVMGMDSGEEKPIEGKEYIVFIYPSPGEEIRRRADAPLEEVIRAVKLMPADSQTVRNVVNAIKATPSVGQKTDEGATPRIPLATPPK